MVAELSLSLKNDFSELADAASQITEFLESHAVSAEATFAIDLAVEELVTNIIKYGYDDSAAHEIFLRLTLDALGLEIQIRDDGHAFDPFTHAAPAVDLPVDEREEGGLGLHFVRNLMDSHEYCRRDGGNIVTLRKDFHS